MIGIEKLLRRRTLSMLLVVAGIFVLMPAIVRAQSLICTSGTLSDPDYPFNGVETDVEQTVCASSSLSYANIENDSYLTYGDLSTLGVYGVSEEVYITNSYGSIQYDSGMQLDTTSDIGGSPVEIPAPGIPAGYWITTNYNECMNQAYYYDSDPNQCYWDFPETGLSIQMPNPPALNVSTSGSPTASGQSVTFTANISVNVSGQPIYFYDGSTQIGYGTVSGTTASFTTTALATGFHLITASFTGDCCNSAATSAPVSQAVGVIYGYVITPPGAPSGYDGDGKLLSYADSVMGLASVGYDSLSRMSSASLLPSIAGNSYYCWSYDDFGNRTNEYGSNLPFQGTQPCVAASGGTLSNEWANYTLDGTPYTANNGKNQVSATSQSPGGYLYDSAGDVLNDGINQYRYDAEGRMCAMQNGGTITGYLYNADGQRVASGTLSSLNCNTGFTPGSEEVYGQDGEELTGVSVSGGGSLTWQHTNVYAAGELFASYDPNGLHFLLHDWLGTTRVQTNYAGSPEQTCQNLFFGNLLNCTNSKILPTNFHFAGLQYDQETEHNPGDGLDHATARQYTSLLGRWMSPDPYDGSMDTGNPQSLNRYSYVGNGPLFLNDPSGQDACAATVGAGFASANPAGVAVGAGVCLAELIGGAIGGAHLIADLIHFFDPHATLKGTTVPRPPWKDAERIGGLHPFNIASVLGLQAGCEFGVCIDNYTHGSVSGHGHCTYWLGVGCRTSTFPALINMTAIGHWICKRSPENRVQASVQFGTAKGALTGGLVGAAEGAAADGVGAVPGFIIGAVYGGAGGAGRGVMIGSATASACSVLGAYSY